MSLGRSAFFTFAAAVVVAACSSKTPPVTPVAPGGAGAGPAVKEPAASGATADGGAHDDPGKAGKGADGKPAKTAADHHRDFMGGCAKKAASSPDYCECAWGEFRKAFTDEEMSAGDMPPAKLATVKTQISGACSSKIPEESVKQDFAKSCIGKTPDMKPYCDCTWGEFRKRFSAGELADEGTVTSERFLAARAPVVKTCGSKMPESVSKEAFMKGCVKDASADKFCGCAWKELRKTASPAEIESGTFDQKTIFAQLEKSCGKLRPK